jgi:iron complex transport system permease protein
MITTKPLHAGRLAPWAALPLLGLAVLGALAVGVALGPVTVPLHEMVLTVLQKLGFSVSGAEIPRAHAIIIGEIRLPRALAAALVGAALGLSGAVMQGVFRNPLASPYILGLASGASAGAAMVIALGLPALWGQLALPVGSFAGGALAVALVYGLARARRGRPSTLTLILAGVALSALFSSVTSLLIVLSGEQMREIIFWILGGLGRARWSSLPWLAGIVLAGLLLLTPFARDLNALALGEEGAQHLGVAPERLKRLLLGVVTLLTGAAVALAGTIGFIGLITPHALRLVVGPDHRVLLPASALAGAGFLVLADAAARTMLAPIELPVGILTALCGAPFFLYLLLTRRGGEMR